MTTLTEGVKTDGGLSDEAAAETLLARWTDAKRPSDTNEGEPPANTDTDDGDDDDATMLELAEEDENDTEEGDTSDDGDNEEDDAGLVAGDDHKVQITVDGQVQTVTVAALKRLYGQEASLTRKSQEVAEARKAAEAEAERALTVTQRLLDKAEERFAPFAKIDWMVAQQRLNADEFAALREEARSAYQELEFLKADSSQFIETVRAERARQIAEAAKETVATLERDIPGWNREVYDQLRNFAVESGMDMETVNNIVDPAAIKMMHAAMKYHQLKAKAAQKKTVAPAATKKVVKPSNKAPNTRAVKSKAEEAKSRLASTGRDDDAIATLLARWERDPS